MKRLSVPCLIELESHLSYMMTFRGNSFNISSRSAADLRNLSAAEIAAELNLSVRSSLPSDENATVRALNWRDVEYTDRGGSGPLLLLRRKGQPPLFFAFSPTHMYRVDAKLK